MTPDPRWLPFFKIIFGCLLLFSLAALAAIIGLGHVEEKTSFGLANIITGLLILTGQFAQWAFKGGDKQAKEKKED